MELFQIIEDAFQAAQIGDALRLKEILESHPSFANTENNEGLTLLGYAAHFGKEGSVKVLIDHAADIDALSHSQISYIPSNTALHAAIAGERNMDVIKMLLTHNAKTNIFDSEGHTSLHSAAFHDDNIEMISLLIEHGADVNARVNGGEPALSIAIKQGNHNVAALLRQIADMSAE